MALVIPPYLQKNDLVGIVCPAGFMPREKTDTCVATLKKWGYQVKIGPTVGHSFHYFSGTDAERRDDLQSMLDDPNVKAILCGRGGYGTSRIVDQLNWKMFRKHPKWIIGFSDITVLHSVLLTKLKTASIHAPMAAAFNDDGFKNPYIRSLKQALAGVPASYKLPAAALNRNGIAEGQLIGGNLSLLIHQLATPSAFDTRGKILFMEDTGEYLYNIDRMLVQLKRAGKLAPLAGLIAGGFTDLKDTTTPFGQPVESIIAGQLADYDFPVCFHFPVSHATENYALKIGCNYELKVGKSVTLKELT